MGRQRHCLACGVLSYLAALPCLSLSLSLSLSLCVCCEAAVLGPRPSPLACAAVGRPTADASGGLARYQEVCPKEMRAAAPFLIVIDDPGKVEAGYNDPKGYIWCAPSVDVPVVWGGHGAPSCGWCWRELLLLLQKAVSGPLDRTLAPCLGGTGNPERQRVLCQLGCAWPRGAVHGASSPLAPPPKRPPVPFARLNLGSR